MKTIFTLTMGLAIVSTAHAACLRPLPSAHYACTPTFPQIKEQIGSAGQGGRAGMPQFNIWANYELYDPYSHNIPTVGYDKQSVHTMFVANMNYGFDSSRTSYRWIQLKMRDMSDVEWARLSFLYVAEGGNLQVLSDLMAPYSSPAEMHKIAGFFGPAVVASSVARLWPLAMKQQYFAMPAPAVQPQSAFHYHSLGYDPRNGLRYVRAATVAPLVEQLDMTLYEIYLDYRTAGVGASVAASLYMAGQVAYLQMTIAAAVGYGVGNAMLWVGDVISPGFSDRLAAELGARIANAVGNINYIQPAVPYLTTGGCGCTITVQFDDMVQKD